ncbi:hypothetical protein RCCS2_03584 [Roseobacter sp. CCS2]|nr:hypothetical protein RCCS2_03584 [Roseobacter sp. CCS2]
MSVLLIQERTQFPTPAWVLQLTQSLRLDLADTFACHAELLAHFFKRVVGIHADAKTHAQHAFFAWCEGCQDPCRRLFQVLLNSGIQRQDRILILNEVAQLAVFLITNWCLKADRFFGDLHDLANLFQRHLQLFCQFLWCRLATNFMQHLAPGADQFVDRLDHMHRNTDRARLIRNRAGDRLTDPPCRIGGEFVTAAIFKLINRLHQADVTFLNKIKELQATVRVFLGNGNHQTQIRLDHFFLGLTCFFFALLDLLHDAAEFGDIDANVLTNLSHIAAQFFDLAGRLLDHHLPAATGLFAHIIQPVRIQLAPAIRLDKLTAVDAGLVSQFHHRAVDRHDPAVDAVKLVNQRLDPVVVQVKRIHQFHNLGPQLLILFFLLVREG